MLHSNHFVQTKPESRRKRSRGQNQDKHPKEKNGTALNVVSALTKEKTTVRNAILISTVGTGVRFATEIRLSVVRLTVFAFAGDTIILLPVMSVE